MARWCVTELERARVVEASGRVLQSGYPAYLGRIRKIDDGYALACLSRRDPLIEFLKTEREFVARMKANIDPRHWISPRATPEFSHDFPIELGATRLFGEIKPWAPSFSYGLVIETDRAMMPDWFGSFPCEWHSSCDIRCRRVERKPDRRKPRQRGDPEI